MQPGQNYTLRGIAKRQAVATNVPCHPQFSPHPAGKFKLDPCETPYCTWDLKLPKRIHQLRLVSIRDADRPVSTGDPHGDAVDSQLTAISLAQAFEYEVDPQEEVGIYDKNGLVDLDYKPDESDPSQKTINIHLWAQLENELGMSETQANEHASKSTKALVKLFEGLKMDGTKSLSINDCHSTQVRMPVGIRFPELMTLAERFVLLSGRSADEVDCTGKTCGHGGNLFIDG
jgi:hypothetical protein